MKSFEKINHIIYHVKLIRFSEGFRYHQKTWRRGIRTSFLGQKES